MRPMGSKYFNAETFRLRSRRQRRMAAFARQQYPSAGVRHQRANPKTCTGSDDADRTARLRLRLSFAACIQGLGVYG
jgi:hypothetical protein